MSRLLDAYAQVVGAGVIDQLRHLASRLEGKRVVHINSTREGGGVAEILYRLLPIKQELGLEAHWEVILGDERFFLATKKIHNALQGQREDLEPRLVDAYHAINRANAERLRPLLEEADFVFIHDPQPAPLLGLFPKRRGKWIWRCHIDASRPHRPVWRMLREHVSGYDASVYSLAAFAKPLPHPQYLITPSIDPLSEKNVPLPESELSAVAQRFGLDRGRPLLVQVSRFDRFKDPLGVIAAYRLVKAQVPAQLVLAGSGATDDPEGPEVLNRVQEAAGADPDLKVLMLPPDAHRTINALQRLATVVLQKSVREGFGLTVSEALWKRRPVVAGEAGGIVLQVIHGHTGFLVNSPEGAALRIRQLLAMPELAARCSENGHRHVRDNFLLTRHVREYLTLMLALAESCGARLEVAA